MHSSRMRTARPCVCCWGGGGVVQGGEGGPVQGGRVVQGEGGVVQGEMLSRVEGGVVQGREVLSRGG